MLKVVMAKGKILKKGGGDLEAQKQHVDSSKQTIGKQNVDLFQPGLGEQNVLPLELKHGEQNVTPSKLRVDESSNLCGLKFIMVIVCNSNDEVIPNTNWDFRLKNGGLDCFRIYIH